MLDGVYLCWHVFPASRMRLAMKSKSASYPQPEGSLGDAMLKGAGPLEGTTFGESEKPRFCG